jgi:hypothetical protein
MLAPANRGTHIRRALVLVLFALSFNVQSLRVRADGDGPIRLHPKNPHYFLFHGRTMELITSGEHYGAVLNADMDYKKYLATLASDGLNFTRIFGGIYLEVPEKSFGIQRNDLAPKPERFIAPWARSGEPGYAGGGNKFDLTKWNPEYFERYRDFLAEASRRGIVVEISLFSSHYGDQQWNVSVLNAANNINQTNAIDWKLAETLVNGNLLKFQEAYVRKLVREANEFDNVIFEIQNEPWSDRPSYEDVINPYLQQPARDRYPNSVEVADELSLAWQARVAEWISSEEAVLPNKHLIAQNYCNFRCSVRAQFPHVSVLNFHYAYPEAVTENYGLEKVIAYDETGFLGRDDEAYRRQAWNFMLSGGGTFDALDYSFSAGHEDGMDIEPNGPGGGSATLRKQLGILKRFLEGFSLADLKLDRESVKHASGAHAHVLSSHGREYAIYLDGSGPTEVRLQLPGGEYSAEWINVESGVTERTERFRPSEEIQSLNSPNFKNGIALRIVNLAPPAR